MKSNGETDSIDGEDEEEQAGEDNGGHEDEDHSIRYEGNKDDNHFGATNLEDV